MNELWVERYRPKNIDECILPQRTKDIFKGYIQKKEMPHLLLSESQGVGKTTVAKALVRELSAESLFVDASSDNGKSMIETIVEPFAQTISIVNMDVPKVVILDEYIEENETIRIGTIDEYTDVKINTLENGKFYPVVSMNMETKELENDMAFLCTDKEDELYEVTLSNGEKIICNSMHPFVIEDENGNMYKKRLKDGLEGLTCFITKSEKNQTFDKVTIVSVKKLNRTGRVMDVHVLKNHTFITSNGLVTSNCDGMTISAQKAFRPTIELYSKSTRFIFTCNFPEKIIAPIKSRCSCFDFSIRKEDKPELLKQFFVRCCKILTENEVEYDKKVLSIFIAKMFPDFRRIINELQSYSSAYGRIDEGILTVGLENELADELYPILINHKFDEARKWLIETVASPEDIISSLYAKLNDYIEKEKQPAIILSLAQYQYYGSQVMNQQINLMAMLTEIMSNV